MFHPLQRIHVQLAVRRQLLDKGFSRRQVNSVIDQLDDDTIQTVAEANAISTSLPVGAIGDGTIINAIIEWLKSPQGQALIAALVQLLIHALGGL